MLKGGLLILLLTLPGMGCGSCPMTERGSATSQDGAFTAADTVDECGGATVADYTEVVLRPGPEAKQAYREAVVLQIGGHTSVELEWTSNRSLRLTIPQSAWVTTLRPELHGVTITLVRQEPERAR